ncbi:hypothetical protein H6P81_016992 [Aristolochia fimbriata]|uniref:Ribosome biogenesis protein BMS1/TSR1 C-terminal domain-containing protein n=1 Tax=Aristolochia fimbriata TaxID=158543 RepID=A0AAV7E154_ARIFI|nr:hypothetical protein H6P81_016992 [Aristolochia fimbriata]
MKWSNKVLFGLSSSVNVKALARDLMMLLSSEGDILKSNTIASPNYKHRATVLEAPYGNLQSFMEMAKVADLIAFVASASILPDDDYIDEFGHQFAAFGSLKSVDPDRIMLKKIILTGYPQRVSKLKATVQFMFHNPDNVRWYKPVEVWTKCGRRGRVKEPVGTHSSVCLATTSFLVPDPENFGGLDGKLPYAKLGLCPRPIVASSFFPLKFLNPEISKNDFFNE